MTTDADWDDYVRMTRFLLGFFLDLTTHHEIGDGRSNEDGRQRTEDNTQDHGEGEAADAGTTEDEDAEEHD